MILFGQNVNPLTNEEKKFWSEDGVCSKKTNMGLSSRLKHGPLNTFCL
jgi:hypothetical protein